MWWRASKTLSSPRRRESKRKLSPRAATNSVSGVFRRPGLPVTEDDFTHIREHIKAGQQPWTDWRNKLSRRGPCYQPGFVAAEIDRTFTVP